MADYVSDFLFYPDDVFRRFLRIAGVLQYEIDEAVNDKEVKECEIWTNLAQTYASEKYEQWCCAAGVEAPEVDPVDELASKVCSHMYMHNVNKIAK